MNLEEKWPCYNGTALYMFSKLHCLPMRKDFSYLCLRIVRKCERISISTKVIPLLEKTRAVVPPRSNPAAAAFTVVIASQYVTPCCDWGRARGMTKQLFGNAYWSFVRGIHR